jgi:hypothetical protein
MIVRNVCAPAQRQLGWWALALGAALLATPKLDAATFTFNNPNCSGFVVSGSPPTQTVACATGGAVPVCTPATPQTTVAVGTQVTIAANCTNSPTSYLWTGGGCGANGATTSCTVTKSRSATITFTVAGINGAGTGSTGQISVTWQ